MMKKNTKLEQSLQIYSEFRYRLIPFIWEKTKLRPLKQTKINCTTFSFLDFGFLISQNTGDHVHVSFSLLESWLLYKHASRVPISVMNTCFEKVLAQIETQMKFQSLNTINKTVSYTISRPKKSSNWPIKSTKYDKKKTSTRKRKPNRNSLSAFTTVHKTTNFSIWEGEKKVK